MVERYGFGWQDRHKAALKASRVPGGSAFGGGGYRHVPGQTGLYSEYIARGGPPEGIGTANIMAGGRMAAYRAGVRLAGSPLRAPITYTSIRGGPPVFVPTESLKGGEAFMPLPGSPLERGIFGGGVGGGLTVGGSTTASGSTALGGNILGGNALGGGTGGGGDLSSTINNLSGGLMNTVTSYLPLAIKVIVAVIAIKIVLSLIGGRK